MFLTISSSEQHLASMRTNWNRFFSGYYPLNVNPRGPFVNMSDGCRAWGRDAASTTGEGEPAQAKRARLEVPEAGVSNCYTSKSFLGRLTTCWKLVLTNFSSFRVQWKSSTRAPTMRISQYAGFHPQLLHLYAFLPKHFVHKSSWTFPHYSEGVWTI